jgi:hypothetical protein
MLAYEWSFFVGCGLTIEGSMEALVSFAVMACGGGLYVGTAEAVDIGILVGLVGQGGGLVAVISSVFSLETSCSKVVILA